jgi:signal transduction histidine kinase
MDGTTEPKSSPPQSVPEAAVRTLRHEVGDLLQTVYATAALLQHRLPAGCDQERRILADMRAKGEACRVLLDLAHDLVCPMSMNCESIQWRELLAPLIAVAAERHPALRIEPTWDNVPPLCADAQRLEQACRLLLTEVCSGAARQVDVRLASKNGERNVQCRIIRDGDRLSAAEVENFFQLGRTSTGGPSSIGMALVRRIVDLHGGQIAAEVPDNGGLCLTLCLPASRGD